MAKKQQPLEAAEAQKYTAPRVPPGMPVVWWDDLGDYEAGHPPTAPAFVVTAGTNTVSLAILAERSHNFLLREGVRHVTDPDKQQVRVVGEGVWDFPDWLQSLWRRVEACEAVVRDLTETK